MVPPHGQSRLHLGGLSPKLTALATGTEGLQYTEKVCQDLFPEPAQRSLDISRHHKIVNFHRRVGQNQLLVFERTRESYSNFRSIIFFLGGDFGSNFGSKIIPQSIQDHFDAPKSL